MPAKLLKNFLDSHQVKYLSLMHSPAFTAPEVAESAHISGKQLAKAVIVKMDGNMAMVVLPSTEHVNFAKLREVTGIHDIELASEFDFKDIFLGCEIGAMPPFGNLYHVPVYVDSALAKQDHILFNAGSHSELIEMKFADFERLVQPKIVAIC